MAYRNTFFRWLFLYSLTFGLTYVLKLFTYLCPETGQKCRGTFAKATHLRRMAKWKTCWILRHQRHSLHNLDDCAAQVSLKSAL